MPQYFSLNALITLLPAVAVHLQRWPKVDPAFLDELLDRLPSYTQVDRDELAYWGRVLTGVRGSQDPKKVAQARLDLAARGVPDAVIHNVILKVTEDVVNNVWNRNAGVSSNYSTSRGQVQNNVSQYTQKPSFAAEPAVLSFGVVTPGQNTRLQLRITGGPGQVLVGNGNIKVDRTSFGSTPCDLQVDVELAEKGQLLLSHLLLQGPGDTTLQIGVNALAGEVATAQSNFQIHVSVDEQQEEKFVWLRKPLEDVGGPLLVSPPPDENQSGRGFFRRHGRPKR